MKPAIVVVLVLSILSGILFWAYSSRVFNQKPAEEKNKQITLTFWGLWDDEQTLKPVIEAYQQNHPNVKINYSKQSLLNYRTRLQTQIRAGQGPDIFVIHGSWVRPMFLNDLTPAPASVFKTTDYTQSFYPIFKDILTSGDRIYGVSMEADGLALYYNEDILRAANVNPPKTWQEFMDAAKKMTVKNQDGQIQTAGAALGTTTNVDFWPEIIGLLFLQQPNVNLASPATKEGAEVLQFYTSFVTDPRTKTWDTTMLSSTSMFAQGKLAFYFAPARQAQIIKNTNPNLNFKTAPVPQLPGGNIAWGSFWAQAVSASSANSDQAWEFLKYLTSPAGLQLTYQQQTQTRIGYPFPRVDMAGLLVNDPILGTYIAQAPIAKAWYLNSGTQDAGINDEMIKIYEQAVNSTLGSGDALGALGAASGPIAQTLEKYQPRPVPVVTK